ncbi:MAG: alpha/beta hydrolase [Promethearchaeota archaeon]|nr:MAG: alpha/beta hydrolase [Candidatus Lokiarchaeota archaeon]
MSKLTYKDYWFNYVVDEEPEKIKELIHEEYISSQGIKIHLDIFDTKEKDLDKTIIFCHGTSVYSRFYAEWLYNLYKKRFRVVALDLPGHGLSGGKRGHFNMKLLSKAIYDVNTWVIENYGHRNAIMGSSLGGINALYSAAFDDDRLFGAVCHNAAIFNEKAYQKIIEMNLKLKLLLPFIPVAAKIAPKAQFSVFLYLDFYRLCKTERFSKRIPLLLDDEILADKYTTTAIRTQMKAPLAKPIEKIKTPVMIINGEKDVLFSKDYMEEIYNRLTCPNKKLEIIEDASHLIFQENISVCLEKIVPWLNNIL